MSYSTSLVVDIMLVVLVDTLQKRRKLIAIVLFIIFDLWLVSFCGQILQAHRSNITTRIHNAQTSQPLSDDQGDVFGVDNTLAGIGRAFSAVEITGLRAVVAATDGLTVAEHGLGIAGKATLRALVATITVTAQVLGRSLLFVGKIVIFPFVMVGKVTGFVFGGISRVASTHFGSVIHPGQADAAVPVITPEQAHQVSLIQSGTLDVKPVSPIGSGGACDSGAGNGGYPLEWCNAPMDSIQTVAYSSDRINRECTSYAFWYFTQIEGHTDFHVTGNANRWARTSNYPVHANPAVGAIAVETGGYYGHVAIVQALPGQTHDGAVVPAGYVLVSEMNYDWLGHFRYSYSPLSKFSAYIYR